MGKKKAGACVFRWWVYLVFVTFLREAMFVGDLITLFCFFFFSSGWWRFLGSCSFPFLMEGFPFIELTKLSLFIFVFLVHIFGTCAYTISISSTNSILPFVPLRLVAPIIFDLTITYLWATTPLFFLFTPPSINYLLTFPPCSVPLTCDIITCNFSPFSSSCRLTPSFPPVFLTFCSFALLLVSPLCTLY